VAQFVIGLAIVVCGFVGARWPSPVRAAMAVVGVTVLAAGVVLFALGASALGPSLTPYPRPSEGAMLRERGIYRRVRHPIYGGVLLAAIGWSLARSPLALVATVLLWLLLELKSRHEESMLLERYPEYEAYRARVRRRFVPALY
jgi:protein-S-isoprenylcysteine O-methyltransferase Ste14